VCKPFTHHASSTHGRQSRSQGGSTSSLLLPLWLLLLQLKFLLLLCKTSACEQCRELGVLPQAPPQGLCVPANPQVGIIW